MMWPCNIMTSSLTDREDRRAALLTVSCILLNLGLFAVLLIITPLVAGIIVGLLLPRRWAIQVGLIGALLAYAPLFIWSSITRDNTLDFYTIGMATLLLALVGCLGGLIGSQLALLFQRHNVRYQR